MGKLRQLLGVHWSMLPLLWCACVLWWWVDPVGGLSHPQWALKGIERFCYDPNEDCGPDSWGGTCRTGERQSPIDISSHKSPNNVFPHVTFFQFNREYITNQRSFFARNTGHTFQVQLQESDDPTSELEVWGAAMRDKYRFGQLHFHWGSEHTFNGVRYPLELHIVHHKAQYATCVEAFDAEDDPEALAVFAIFFKVGAHNPALDSITRVANLPENREQREAFMQYMMQHLNIQDLLPTKLNFVRYRGSLTTPPCTENVLWTVFLEPVTISLQQLGVFQMLLNEEEMRFMNFRPTQPHNGRKVQYFGVPAIKRSLIAAANHKSSLMIELVVRLMWALLEFFRINFLANVTLWRQLGDLFKRLIFPTPIYINVDKPLV